MAVPPLLYDSRSWTLTKAYHHHLKQIESEYDDIGKELGIFNLNEKLNDYGKQWKKHIV